MKKLTIATMAAHMFIVIAIGHGAVPFGVMIIVAIGNIFRDTGADNLLESPFLPAAITGALGQICLLITMLSDNKYFNLVVITGVLLLGASFIIVLYALSSESTAKISVVTGLPFIFLGVILAVRAFYAMIQVEESEE
jgi:hypothetical protein